MPKLECRICNKKFISTNMYYCHLYGHINHTTELTVDEIIKSTKYHERRRDVKKKSYEKRKIECPIIQCSLCEFKTHLKASFRRHLIAVHSQEELLILGYSPEFIELHTEKHKKRLEYLKNYNKNISSENDNMIQSSEFSESYESENEEPPTEQQINITATLPINMFTNHFPLPISQSIALPITNPFLLPISRPIPIPTLTVKRPIPIPTLTVKRPIPIPTLPSLITPILFH
jgi:hypothetical protein